MSRQLISHSPDLQQLWDEGYDIEIRGGHLLVKNVPYVNSRKEVAYGTLVSVLTQAGGVTTAPADHVAKFIGDHPCYANGAELHKIKHSSQTEVLDRALVVQHSFSAKPTTGAYKNYHHKMTTYAEMFCAEAQRIDPDVTARPCRFIAADEPDDVFHYHDTASSRAGIMAVSRKLEVAKVAIVGLGGTGSYILDLMAKTPVGEIHLFDADRHLQHNAFRSPGAPSIEELRAIPQKVAYFQVIYSRMHRGIVAHDVFISADNVDLLVEMDFVFLCMDQGEAKRIIVEKLEAAGKPFIDVGLGVKLDDGSLGGILRVTASTPTKRDHVRSRNRIPFSDGGANNDYSRNIQVADLNALNGALAVVKWKKMMGFYRDLEREHFSAYTIDGNALANEDPA
jgi:hypothetical protein